ncbi:MAG: winged helix-turn-helix domain-containing protein, partial [Acetobacteraceae bacterium]|nr:winged helix-turn-helix domain-containing protein [Acetobacteraceae bacterium]
MRPLPVAKNSSRLLRWHTLTLDLDAQRCFVGDVGVAASPKEFALLALLVSRRNLPLTKENIMASLFGAEHGRDLRQADMMVARLRLLLSRLGLAGIISTLSGRGYSILDDDREGTPSLDTRPRTGREEVFAAA